MSLVDIIPTGKCTKKFLDVTMFWIILMRCRDLKRKGIGSWLKLWLSGGYFYFHLINLYGKPYSVGKDSPGVPLKLTAEMGTSGMKRNTVEEVYTRIIQDLLEAERLFKTLPEGEWSLQNNRINLPCVQLLISRVYLYMENWAQALAYGEKSYYRLWLRSIGFKWRASTQ